MSHGAARLLPWRAIAVALSCLVLLPGLPAARAAQGEAGGRDANAANQEEARTLYRLAVRYEHGDGVAKDFIKSNDLYCQAAKKGHAEAQLRLGIIYARGRSVPRDEGAASTLFAMAAAQGHEHAQRLLHFMIRELQKRPATMLPACMQPDAAPALHLSLELSAPKEE